MENTHKRWPIIIGSTYRAGFLICDQFSIIYDQQGYALVPKDENLPTVKFDEPLFPYSNQDCTPPPTLIRGKTYAAILENGKVFGGFFKNSHGFFATHRWVEVNEKWGLVNEEGDFKVKPIYSSIQFEGELRSSDDLPKAKTNATYKVTKNNIPFRLSFVDGEYKETAFTARPVDRNQVINCKGQYKLKSKNGLWGIVDKKGDILIPQQYRAITCFSNGVAWVPDDVERRWCPIDSDNRSQSAPACTTTYYSSWASHHDPEKFNDDPYENSVLWMKAMLDYGEGRRDTKPGFVPWN